MVMYFVKIVMGIRKDFGFNQNWKIRRSILKCNVTYFSESEWIKIVLKKANHATLFNIGLIFSI